MNGNASTAAEIGNVSDGELSYDSSDDEADMLRHRTMLRKMREEAEAARKAAAAEEAERAKKAKNDAPSGAGITAKRKRGGSSAKKRSAGGASQQNGSKAKKEKKSKRCKCHLARCYECGGACVRCDCTCPSALNARGKLKSRGSRKREETIKPGGVGKLSSPNKKNGKIKRTSSANVELLSKKTCKCHTARCYQCGGACIRCDCICSSKSKAKPKAKVEGKQAKSPSSYYKYEVGQIIEKNFPTHGLFRGKIKGLPCADRGMTWYRVEYEDGDVEDIDVDEISRYVVSLDGNENCLSVSSAAAASGTSSPIVTKKGDLRAIPPWKICTVDGCGKYRQVHCNAMCKSHFSKMNSESTKMPPPAFPQRVFDLLEAADATCTTSGSSARQAEGAPRYFLQRTERPPSRWNVSIYDAAASANKTEELPQHLPDWHVDVTTIVSSGSGPPPPETLGSQYESYSDGSPGVTYYCVNQIWTAQVPLRDVVQWVDDGTAWKIHNVELFKELVLPVLGYDTDKISSFTKQRGNWKMKNVGDGGNTRRHGKFRRGRRDLLELYIQGGTAGAWSDDEQAQQRPQETAQGQGQAESQSQGQVGDHATNNTFEASKVQGEVESSWKLSETRTLGARVFAKFPENGEFYWGNIIDYVGMNKERRFKVLFEDGDTADNLTRHHVCTERWYAENLRNPPFPQPNEDLEKELAKVAMKQNWYKKNNKPT